MLIGIIANFLPPIYASNVSICPAFGCAGRRMSVPEPDMRRKRMRLAALIACLTGLLAVAACTDEELERAAVGGAIGTAVGEVVYDKPIEGLAAGAIVGGLTAGN